MDDTKPTPEANKLPPSTAQTRKTLQKLLNKEKQDEIFHTIQFLEDVPMRLWVEVARKHMPLREILAWKKGSIIEFRKIVGEPLEVMIGDRVIARGEVVVVNDRFGIRISEITRPGERINAVND